MAYGDLKTKVAKIDYLKDRLANNDVWMLKGLVTIFDYQTKEEQTTKTTKENNGVGFSGLDGEILTSFASQVINKGLRTMLESPTPQHIYAERFLSKPQVEILKRKMPKYAGQLYRIAEARKNESAQLIQSK